MHSWGDSGIRCLFPFTSQLKLLHFITAFFNSTFSYPLHFEASIYEKFLTSFEVEQPIFYIFIIICITFFINDLKILDLFFQINVFGENRRDEMYEKVRHPRGINKFDNMFEKTLRIPKRSTMVYSR